MEELTRPYDSTPLLRAVELAGRLGLAPPELARTAADEVRSGATPPVVDRVAERLALPAGVVAALVRAVETAPATAGGGAEGDGPLAVSVLRALVESAQGGAPAPRRGAAADPESAETVRREAPGAGPASPVPPELRDAVAAAGTVPENRLGRYVLLGPIGAGGMGVVWRAWDATLARVIAVKLLREDPAHISPVARERFLREGRAAARLRHPGIVAVHDVGEAGGRPYLTMDFIEGCPLAERLAAGAVPKADGRPGGFKDLRADIELLARVAEAVGFAHRNGIVHRDLKPGNVLLDRDGRPFVTDFGLAKDLTGSSTGQAPETLTREGALLGTPAYMSPEQAKGRPEIGPASDVFSLGVILYQVLTGRLPFAGEDLGALTWSVVAEDPVAPRRLHPRLPRDLESVCLKCLEKQPARRYPEAAALALDLRRWLEGEPVEAQPVPLRRRAVRWVRRHPGISIPAAFVLALAATWLGTRLRQGQLYRERLEARRAFAQDVLEAQAAWRAGDRERFGACAERMDRGAATVLALGAAEPEVGQVHLERGRVRLLAGAYEAAAGDLDRAVELCGPRDPAPPAQRARLFLARYARGLEAARHAIPDPDRAAGASRADLEAAQPGLAQLKRSAERDLAEALRRGPAGGEGPLLQACQAWLADDPESMQRAAEQALAQDLSAEAYHLAGLALLKQGRRPEAIEQLTGAVTLDRGCADAWLARAQARCEDVDVRLKTWIEEIQQGKRPLGDAEALERQLQEALRDARRGRTPDADVNLAGRVLGDLTWKLGELLRKLDPVRHRLGVDGRVREKLLPCIDELKGLDARYQDAHLLFSLGRVVECRAIAWQETPVDTRAELRAAIGYFSEALRRQPELRLARYRRGNAYIELAEVDGERQEDPRSDLGHAIEDYTAFLAVEPDHASARLYRGKSWFMIAEEERRRGGTGEEAGRRAIPDLEGSDDPEACFARSGARGVVAQAEIARGVDAEPELVRALADARVHAEMQAPYDMTMVQGYILRWIARAREGAGRDPVEAYAQSAERYLVPGQKHLSALLAAVDAQVHLGRYAEALALVRRHRDFPEMEVLAAEEKFTRESLASLGAHLATAPPDPARAPGALALAEVAVRLGAGQGPGDLRDLAFVALAAARRHGGVAGGALKADGDFAPLVGDPRWGALEQR